MVTKHRACKCTHAHTHARTQNHVSNANTLHPKFKALNMSNSTMQVYPEFLKESPIYHTSFSTASEHLEGSSSAVWHVESQISTGCTVTLSRPTVRTDCVTTARARPLTRHAKWGAYYLLRWGLMGAVKEKGQGQSLAENIVAVCQYVKHL